MTRIRSVSLFALLGLALLLSSALLASAVPTKRQEATETCDSSCPPGCCFEDECIENPLFCTIANILNADTGNVTTAPVNVTDASEIPLNLLNPDYRPLGVRLFSAEYWCLLFPNDTSQPIGNDEQDAKLGCSPAMVAASGGKLPGLNNGTITTTHFSTGASPDGKTTYVEMGGSFNGSKYPLFPGDTGGQYDSDGMPDPSKPDIRGSPHGSSCIGYDSYIEMLGPVYSDYCIRCCKGPEQLSYCNWTMSGSGCTTVFPGIQISP